MSDLEESDHVNLLSVRIASCNIGTSSLQYNGVDMAEYIYYIF